MVISTYSNTLLSVSMINIDEMRVGCGRERPLGLFEVLARNRQSALGLCGRTRSAREQPPRMFTIPPRQQLSSPKRLAIRAWTVTQLLNTRTHHTHTHTHTHANFVIHAPRDTHTNLLLSSLSNPHASARKSVCIVEMLSPFSLNDAKRTREKKRFIARYPYLSSSG